MIETLALVWPVLLVLIAGSGVIFAAALLVEDLRALLHKPKAGRPTSARWRLDLDDQHVFDEFAAIVANLQAPTGAEPAGDEEGTRQ